MTISIFFSVNLYQLSVNELERSLRHPGPNSVINRLPADFKNRFSIQDLLEEREAQYEDAKDRILSRLILVNMIILLGGGALSYYFAVRTLRPIEEAHEAQSRFTADASHELRTPLAAMRTENEVALMDPKLTIKKAKDVLNSNIEELTKLTNLSAGLLRLAQGEKADLDMEDIAVQDILQDALDRVMPQAEKKHILIHNHANDISAHVRGDRQNLVEALVTVLDNAVKYSYDKTEIAVGAEDTGKNIIIQVADQGIGIKASELPHIFERFYRADVARSKQDSDGYGLGLAIAKNIIEMHDGTISAASNPESGTIFTIQLPRGSGEHSNQSLDSV